MAIRIATDRAKISQDFKDALVELSRERLMQIKQSIETKDRYQAAYYRKEMAPTVLRLAGIVKNPVEALDMVYTRLRGLPYTDYDVIRLDERPDVLFLVGTTKNVEPIHDGLIYNLGPYSVRIPFSKIIGVTRSSGSFQEYGKTEGDTWHFIPLGNTQPNSDRRHPHHYGLWPGWSKTCWGEFNGMISSICKTADIAELFRTVYIYLSRYNSSSPLHGRLEKGDFFWAKVRPAPAPEKPEKKPVRAVRVGARA